MTINERCHLGLIHYPTLDRLGNEITSAMTALDLHDFCRLARTYDLGGVFAQTNLPQQVELMERLLGHWVQGTGGELNPDRRNALEILSMVESLDAAIARLEERYGAKPLVVATSARDDGERVGYRQARAEFEKQQRPVLVIFGTASGLAPQVFELCDMVLEPIGTPSQYNHLSVRSAASIIVDRLFGSD